MNKLYILTNEKLIHSLLTLENQSRKISQLFLDRGGIEQENNVDDDFTEDVRTFPI